MSGSLTATEMVREEKVMGFGEYLRGLLRRSFYLPHFLFI